MPHEFNVALFQWNIIQQVLNQIQLLFYLECVLAARVGIRVIFHGTIFQPEFALDHECMDTPIEYTDNPPRSYVWGEL